MFFTYTITGGDFVNAGNASSEVKKILKQLSVNPKIIKRIVIALYEAEVNVVAHAYCGKVEVTVQAEYVVIEVKDEGPGISDINQAMEEGFSTASREIQEMGFGAGMGLTNIKKNVDEFSIDSTVRVGTNVYMKIFL